jgi:hypothetical protein
VIVVAVAVAISFNLQTTASLLQRALVTVLNTTNTISPPKLNKKAIDHPLCRRSELDMKSGILAVAAAIVAGVNANGNHAGRVHAHQEFHLEKDWLLTTESPELTCGCTTIYSTFYGEATGMLIQDN